MGGMTDLPGAIEAGVSVATALGGAIGFLWVRLERMNRRVTADLEACDDARQTQLIVIEIFWRELERLAPRNAALKRGGKLLEELKRRDDLRQSRGME